MSEETRYVLVSRRLLDDPRYWHGHAAVIALAVIRHAGVEGRADVSVRAIARETQIPQTTVRRVVAAMVAADLVRVDGGMTVVAARERSRRSDRGCATIAPSGCASGSPPSRTSGSPSASSNVADRQENPVAAGEPVAHQKGEPVAHQKGEPNDPVFAPQTLECTPDSHERARPGAHTPERTRAIPCPDKKNNNDGESSTEISIARETSRVTDPIPSPTLPPPQRAPRATGDTGDVEVSPAPVSGSLEPPDDDPDPWGSIGQRYGDAWMGPGAELRLAPHDILEAYRAEWERRTGRPCGALGEMHHGRRAALERQILDAIEDTDCRYHGRKAVSIWYDDPYPAARRWPLALMVSQIGRIMARGRQMGPGEPDPRLAGAGEQFGEDIPF